MRVCVCALSVVMLLTGQLHALVIHGHCYVMYMRAEILIRQVLSYFFKVGKKEERTVYLMQALSGVRL